MDPEVEPQKTARLKNLAQNCSRQFHELSQHEQNQDTTLSRADGFWALRQSASFNLWCSKLGVDSEGHRSIDLRLKDVPEICELLFQLLQSLQSDLEELIQQHVRKVTQDTEAACSQNDTDSEQDDGSLFFESLSSSSEGSQPQTNTEERVVTPREKYRIELKTHVSDTIDRLQGQARRIEHAGAQHRKKRIEIYKEKERPKQVYEGFRKLGAWKANEQFTLASDTIKERTAQSFARRRIRFDYLKEHQKKRRIIPLDQPVERLTLIPRSENVREEVSNIQKDDLPRISNNERTALAQDQRTIFSATVNTEYNLAPQLERKERAESVRSVTLPHVGFPPPPKIEHHRFQCPYCRLDFGENEAGGERWKQHVMHDFEPYFCTFKNCDAPFDVPNSFDGLLSHLQTHLPVRHHIDEPNGKHSEYAEEKFEDHIQSQGEVSTEVMADLKEVSRRKGAFLFESCPFCGGYPEDLEKRFKNRDSVEAQIELRKHVKQHMQEIALFLPPYRSDIFDKDDDPNASGATNRRSIRDVIPEDPLDFIVNCDRQNCDCKHSGKAPEVPAETKDSLAPGETFLPPQPQVLWTCCTCFEVNPLTQDYKCMFCGLHYYCQSCERSESESQPFDGDWQNLLGDAPIYDLNNITDEECLEDERLLPFMIRFAIGDWEPSLNDAESAVYASGDERATYMRLLVEGYMKSESKARDHRQLPSITETLGLIKTILILNAEPRSPSIDSSLWINARNGSLESVRELTAKMQSPHSNSPNNTSIFEIALANVKQLDGTSFRAPFSGLGRDAAFYQNSPVPVWIEWSSFDILCTDPWDQVKLDELLNMLVQVGQKEEFRVPRCLGYLKLNDGGKFGLIFECPLPNLVLEDSPPTLGDFYSASTLPSVAERRSLIVKLNATITSLLKADNLHQDIRSSNILFFRDGINGEPFISGFKVKDYFGRTPTYWADLYRHPDTRETFHNHLNKDLVPIATVDAMYSLGIVYLEIAYWSLIQDIMGIDISRIEYMTSFAEFARIRHRLLSRKESHIIGQVANELGRDVEHFIRSCIIGTVDYIELDDKQSDPREEDNNIGESSDASQESSVLLDSNVPELGRVTSRRNSTSFSFEPLNDQLANILFPSSEENPYNEDEIEEIARLLRNVGHIGFENPRTYIMLRLIDQLEEMELLLESGFNEFHFPATFEQLPDSLSKSAKKGIVAKQNLIMTHGRMLKRLRHCHNLTIGESLFTVLSTIFENETGQVDRIRSMYTQQPYVFKRIYRASGFEPSQIDQFAASVFSMRKWGHRHLVQFEGSLTTTSELGIMMSPAARWTLQDVLDNPTHFHFPIQSAYGCLATAFHYLHEKNVQYDKEVTPSDILIFAGTPLLTGIGVPTTSKLKRYCAPETVVKRYHNHAANIWSLGCIFLEMTVVLQDQSIQWLQEYFRSPEYSYWASSDRTQQLLGVLKLSSNKELTQPLECIERMLHEHPQGRPTALQVKRMMIHDPFISPNFCGPCCRGGDDTLNSERKEEPIPMNTPRAPRDQQFSELRRFFKLQENPATASEETPNVGRVMLETAQANYAKFQLGDHVRLRRDIRFRKFEVVNIRIDAQNENPEYQLKKIGERDHNMYRDGKWYPEKELRITKDV